MADQAHWRDWHDAVEAALADGEVPESNRFARREATNGQTDSTDRARPLEFDEVGFPIAQPVPDFRRRVKRLREL